MSPAHHPWQLRPDPASPFPHLLPGPGTNLWGGQAGEPEPEEGGDQRGEGRAAAFRYQAWPDPGWGELEVALGDVGRQLPGLLTPIVVPDSLSGPPAAFLMQMHPQEDLQTVRSD